MPRSTKPLRDQLRAAPGEIHVIAYLMAGYPDLSSSIEIGKRMVAVGAAALELGVPFSDPLADGPSIQRAGQAALAGGTTVGAALEAAAAVAEEGVPIILMTAVNPILSYDPRRFAADAAEAGVAGVIVPDLPPGEAEPVTGWLHSAGLDTIFLVAPTSSDERIETICRASSGFVYCVTVTGVTGARRELAPGLAGLLTRVRQNTDLPVAAGFGISRPDHVRSLQGLADAAVVGAALVDEIHAGRDPSVLLKGLVSACR